METPTLEMAIQVMNKDGLVINASSCQRELNALKAKIIILQGILALALAEAQETYQSEYRSANIINNSDGVGQKFDYAPYPVLPKWVEAGLLALEK